MNLSTLFGNHHDVEEQLTSILTSYLQFRAKYLIKASLSKIMVGICSDLNSLLTAALLKQAVGNNIIALIIDLGTTKTGQLIDYCNKLGLETYILDRGKAYQNELSAYKLHKQADVLRFYYRFTNYHLLIQAEKMKAGVIDTLDKSNRLLAIRPEGFYGQVMPFYSLYKSQLINLAKFLQVPSDLYSLNCPYESFRYIDDTYFTWEQIDQILCLINDKQQALEQIAQEQKIDLQWLKKLQSCLNKESLITQPSQLII